MRRLGGPAAGWEATVVRVLAAHGGARSRWELADPPAPLAAILLAAGYRPLLEAAPLGADTAAIAASDRFADDGPTRVRPCEEPADLRRWVDVFHDSRAIAAPPDAPWDLLLRPPSRLYLAEWEGRAVGAAGLLLAESLGVGLLWGASVPAGHARRGVWSRLVRARLADAHAAGVPTLITQARIDTSAGHLRKLGFHDVGPTVTQWERPAVTSR